MNMEKGEGRRELGGNMEKRRREKGTWRKGEGRREHGERRREKGTWRREKGEGSMGKGEFNFYIRFHLSISIPIFAV
jgi:hypothetical protein